MRQLKGRAVMRSTAALIAVGVVAAVALSLAPRSEAGTPTSVFRFSALLLHESQVFDQGWQRVDGAEFPQSALRLRTTSWNYTEVIIHNPSNGTVPFCWKVTSPSGIGTPNCEGTIPANGVVIFDTFNLTEGGQLIDPKGIFEVEHNNLSGPIVVWAHYNKHSKGEIVYASKTVQIFAIQGRRISDGVFVSTVSTPPFGSGVSIDVERVVPVQIPL